MGNKNSDETEKKVFNVVKTIPIVGWIYRAPRAIVYAAKKNKGEVMRCGQFDLAEELNPIKKVYNLTKNSVALGFKYEQGIWLGTRPLSGLSGNPIDLSISPGADLRHYSLMCNGVIYELKEKYSDKTSKIVNSSYNGEEGF